MGNAFTVVDRGSGMVLSGQFLVDTDQRETEMIAPTVTSDHQRRLPRYPKVEECSFVDAGKCDRPNCRYSLLAERHHFEQWAPEDQRELIELLPDTCALDYASYGGMLLDEVSAYLGLARARVEQVEISALRKLARTKELRRARWDGR